MLGRLVIMIGALVGIAFAVPQVLAPLMLAASDRTEAKAIPTTSGARAPSIRREVTGRGRTHSVKADRSGHFIVEGRIGGRSVDFLVDTGATTIALSEPTANRLGIRPARGAFKRSISTANGVIQAAPVTLRSVSVGGIRVQNVEAMVLPAGALHVDLLGMSFLGRLSEFEIAHNRLVPSQ